jgi:tetratricopeptide (TPR) repeat protein
MKQKRRREFYKEGSTRSKKLSAHPEKTTEAASWLGDWFRILPLIGIALIALCTVIIYGQTVRVPPIDYEDPFYLVHSPYVDVPTAFSRLSAVWTEPYFANFHPVTTTTWLLDRALADQSKPFDGRPFRVTNLLYAVIAASLLIPLYRRLGIPSILAVLGAIVFAVHPIHTEVVAWLSARKDLISLVFMILSLLAWLWARAATTPKQWRSRHAVTILLVLLAVLSKPIAVIVPALFVAYEFCSGPHVSVQRWRWASRYDHPIVTRALALTAIFLATASVSGVIFRSLLLRDPVHGGWLILVPIALLLSMLALPPSAPDMAAFREGSAGIRVLGPPLVVLSVLSGSGSAWTFWAQSQVGAIKGGLTLVPTINLTFEAMLAYAWKTFVPAYMSASYTWSEFPYVSLKGILGAALVCAAVWTAMRLAGAPDRNRRLVAFGILWFLIALVPVSNIVPTSTKMADRYLFVPTVGAILALLALGAALLPNHRSRQIGVCAALALVVTVYTAGSYNRTEVWCGKTTKWKGRRQPDLSLWTSAVETNPEDTLALTNLSLALLRLNPPEADQALVHLNRALDLSEANQSKIAGNRQLILTPLYEGLGDAYLTQATRLGAVAPGPAGWQQKREAYVNAAKYFRMASVSPSGFASSDARVLSRLAESCEGQAQMDALELATVAPERRDSLIAERDRLRGEAEGSMSRAREMLVAGRVSPTDANYRTVMITRGNLIFDHEAGATNEEKTGYYRQALMLYQEAATLFADDPRPLLYQGLCYERLTGIAQSPDERQRNFKLGEQALRTALTLNVDAPDYSPALPYRALATLYTHVNDFHSVLDSLKNAKQADPTSIDSAQVDRDIQSVEQYLAQQSKGR